MDEKKLNEEVDELRAKIDLAKIDRISKVSKIISLIVVPLMLILFIYGSLKLTELKGDIAKNEIQLKDYKEAKEALQNDMDSIVKQRDSMFVLLRKSTADLGRSTSILWEFKNFIDKKMPKSRTSKEASFFINFRMLEEKIRGDYEYLSKTFSELPKIKDENTWIVIVESNVSREDLVKSEKIEILESIYSKDQIAIYKDAKNIYALAIKGNGSFTRAFRINVELIEEHGINGAYFSGVTNWGKDYLK